MPRYPVFGGGIPAALKQAKPHLVALAKSRGLQNFEIVQQTDDECDLTLIWVVEGRENSIRIWAFARDATVYLRVYMRAAEPKRGRWNCENLRILVRFPGLKGLPARLQAAYVLVSSWKPDDLKRAY